MARRQGKKGDYLMTDDYTGFTSYASQLNKDYWGNYTRKPLIRNLQEVASPLLDPIPVSIYRGPQYEVVNPCIFETMPIFIGLTNVLTPQNSPANQALNLDPAIPDQEVGCTLVIH